jgi:hypothetical protein
LAQIKGELIEASEDRARVQSAADAHARAISTARDNLRASYAQHGITGHPEVKAWRLKQHDTIVEASERWGKQAVAYRHLNTVIRQLGDELERLIQETRK